MNRKEIIIALGNQFKENGKLFCPDFEIDSEKKELYGLLFLYALQSKKITEAGYDLDKGLLIYSPISGNGKTIAMKVLNRFLVQEKSPLSFYIVTIADLANEWKLYEKEEKISGIRAFDRFDKGNWLIDDLGCKEEIFNIWGETVNIGERLIMHLYPKFETGHQKFHFTSNLALHDLIGNESKNIASRYDSRASGRLIKMCNVFEYTARQIRSTAKADSKIKLRDYTVFDPVVFTEIQNQQIKELFKKSYETFAKKKEEEVHKFVDYKSQWLENIKSLAPTLSKMERGEAVRNLTVQMETLGNTVDKESIIEAIKILEDV